MRGGKNINILTLGIVYQGAAIPVYWLILNKQGNSNQRERVALLHRFIRQFGRSQLLGVLGDREFIGQDWWCWLTAEKIPYLIRMKDNQKIALASGKTVLAQSRFADLKIGQSRYLRHARRIKGKRVGLSGLRLESGEWLVTNGSENPLKSMPYAGKLKRCFSA